ncbi:MAG: DUF1080 domain-containing protein [Acidobacteria bacterium]|nr:DUF1080 domain-containing protein [Acidobacteriota bacterium]
MAGETLRVRKGKNIYALRTKDTYRDFELRFEGKAPPKGSSGLKYRVFESRFYHAAVRTGGPIEFFSDAEAFEYQLCDDQGDVGAIQNELERTGALYKLRAPKNAKPRKVGEWNESAIRVQGRKIEHWLNGEKVVDYETESRSLESPLVLQHQGTEMWFRNMKVRRLN